MEHVQANVELENTLIKRNNVDHVQMIVLLARIVLIVKLVHPKNSCSKEDVKRIAQANSSRI